jgi:hypothetical protein
MKILFDIRIGSGGRTYKYSLNIQSYWIIKGKKVCNELITLNGMTSEMVKGIVNEYNKTQTLTGVHLRNINYYLTKKGTSVEKLNSEIEII